ncbi:MAG TPA: hypothetical protein PKC69_12555 [Chitinophagaceae bacterium]|nr:hypothetical protein [Chitinophagaceae bacterium]
MSRTIIRGFFAIAIIAGLSFLAQAQPEHKPGSEKPKPYRILTAGRQITVKTTQPIHNLMVWTAGGHRILEQKNIDAGNYVFRVDVKEKVFFVMIRLRDGKVFSEKIGVQ